MIIQVIIGAATALVVKWIVGLAIAAAVATAVVPLVSQAIRAQQLADSLSAGGQQSMDPGIDTDFTTGTYEPWSILNSAVPTVGLFSGMAMLALIVTSATTFAGAVTRPDCNDPCAGAGMVQTQAAQSAISRLSGLALGIILTEKVVDGLTGAIQMQILEEGDSGEDNLVE